VFLTIRKPNPVESLANLFRASLKIRACYCLAKPKQTDAFQRQSGSGYGFKSGMNASR